MKTNIIYAGVILLILLSVYLAFTHKPYEKYYFLEVDASKYVNGYSYKKQLYKIDKLTGRMWLIQENIEIPVGAKP